MVEGPGMFRLQKRLGASYKPYSRVQLQGQHNSSSAGALDPDCLGLNLDLVTTELCHPGEIT